MGSHSILCLRTTDLGETDNVLPYQFQQKFESEMSSFDQFKKKHQEREKPGHIFHVAKAAVRKARSIGHNQAILVMYV